MVLKFPVILPVAFCVCISYLQLCCAPIHIREHQIVDGRRDRCGLGTSSQYLKHPDIKLAGFDLRPQNGNQLEFSGSFWGEPGKTISISGRPIRVKFANGKEISVPAKLLSRQIKERPNDAPRQMVIPFGKTHTFQVDAGYSASFVILEAEFPSQPIDLEIALPQLTIGADSLPPVIIKYRYTDRWTVIPLNGC